MVAVPPLVTGRTVIDSIGDIYQYAPPILVPPSPPPAPPLVVGRVATDSAGVVFEYIPPNMVQRSGTVLPPTNTSPPTISIISGGGAVGSLIGRINPGTWVPPGPYANQWQSGGVNIPGATGNGYTAQASDVGKMITLVITVTNESGSLSATSNAVGPITGAAVFDPLSLFTGGTTGAYYRDSGNSENTPGFWKDISGAGKDAMQATPALQMIKAAGYAGKPCFRVPDSLVNGAIGFDLPTSLSIDRQNHAWWAIFRSRSNYLGGSRAVLALNPGLTDCMTEFSDATVGGLATVLRTWGTSTQSTTITARSGIVLLMLSATSSGLTMRLNGTQVSAAAYAPGIMTGGFLFNRGDGNHIGGEAYEFGTINRPLTPAEMTNIESYFISNFHAFPTHGQVVIDGDSLTEGQLATTGMGWPTELDNDIGTTWRVVSQGQSAVQAANIAGNVAKTTTTFDPSFAQNIYVISAGTNDLAAGNNAATTMGSLTTCTQAFMAAGFKTIMCTVTPRGLASPNWDSTKEAQRQALNSSILAAPSTVTTTTCDLASIPQFQDPTNATYFESDQLHMTDAAFMIIKNTIKPVILGL